ncbi:hypothetical protein [Agathobaculum sp.]|uniref:hypothetical protein n=1 Tax=Agathobaculum sp. TaxID=2048138 RepID=UPI002A7FE024|nr:hypothetical protein [Agathobaculum sp.]MDY3618208.1 hypothetical protein [Agathobaculum sp.]
MTRTAQGLLLAGFLLCAAFTALQQVQYGMICGRSEQRQDDPKAKACRKRAAVSAILGAALLVANIVIGMLTR